MKKMSVPKAVLVSAGFLLSAILFSVFVFGSVPVGPVLPEEIPAIEAWLVWNDLDTNGNYQDMFYPNDRPIFDNHDERYNYIRSNHRDRPWLNIKKEWVETFAHGEKEIVEVWIKKNNLNEFGDAADTFYPGGTPLFDESIGENITFEKYLLMEHPSRPWNNPEKEQ